MFALCLSGCTARPEPPTSAIEDTPQAAYRVMLRKYPDVMNIEQMCDALRISTKTGYKLLHEGKIPAMKIGRSYRIPKAHLFTYLQICGQHCRAENRQC